jgi:DHA2 family multidrug resistance protein
MTVFGMAALLAPVVGPTLGGYITDNYGWRWIFYLNVPVGALAFFMCRALVEDPEYLKVERAKSRNQSFDTLGLCLLSVTMVCWEIMLSKGQEWDWLGDPFFRVQTLLAGFALGLGGLIYRELRLRNPLVALRTLTDRNFRACCIIIFCAYGVLYANTVSLPELLQSLFGYNATVSGLVLSPAGIFAIMTLLVTGAAMGRGVDARYLMAAGLITMALGNFWMAHLNLEIGPWQVVWPRVVIIMGLSMLFAPLNVAAFIYLPKEVRGGAVGLLALLRNEGGSVGTSVSQIIQERRLQFHSLRLNESLDSLSQPVNNLLTHGQAFFLQHNGDAVLSHQMALGILDQSRTQQALSLAYFDVFSFCFAVGILLVFFVLLMRRSVAEKGAHIGAE